MARVFTITEGLENMGALKTGGQGSVYKARRSNGMISAIKLLPTPIFSESLEDRNYRDFYNEVEKLKKVNQQPNPHVVKILSSGITDSGNFPFIEMEFIEGPELEELLKAPHDPVFTIAETIKVAEHLSSALAHCHRVGVRHGDIKSNNVKLDQASTNYVLLDFGMALMSDEQRRTSLRQAGAIEFMAPEQHEAKMLDQTDIYSFGIVIYELLAGRVPFPLSDKSERARNAVMLAHLEQRPPDLLELRKSNMPAHWSREKKEQEMAIPSWLMQVVQTCLQKDPYRRYANGMELQQFITGRKVESTPSVFAAAPQPGAREMELEKRNRELELQAGRQRQEILDLRAALEEQSGELQVWKQRSLYESNRGVSKGAFYFLLFFCLLLLGFAAYSLFSENYENPFRPNTVNTRLDHDTMHAASTVARQPVIDTPKTQPRVQQPPITVPDPMIFDTTTVPPDNRTILGRYSVRARAHFHNQPDEASRREAYILPVNNAVLDALEETPEFIYVVYTNEAGQTSRGWLRKQDLEKLED